MLCGVQLSVSAPCQLMGVGLCGTKGLFTVSLEVTEVGTPGMHGIAGLLPLTGHLIRLTTGRLVIRCCPGRTCGCLQVHEPFFRPLYHRQLEWL